MGVAGAPELQGTFGRLRRGSPGCPVPGEHGERRCLVLGAKGTLQEILPGSNPRWPRVSRGHPRVRGLRQAR